ncbi:hypothetical protein PHBOTO_004279 [Pseudozyma hubeiensis]|nr:hypothetical protein PHBOTO_004279 [Pseudozyma hubeiensis]
MLTSGSSSNLTDRMNSPAHERTRQFVQQTGAAVFTLDGLNFFCTLPQDPSKTHINCQRIPSS